MKTIEKIFEEIKESSVITEANIKLLKNRSNKENKDICDYDIIGSFGKGLGIPISEEQGTKALLWLKSFIKKNCESNVYGYREISIIKKATPKDFSFRGLYHYQNNFHKEYLPIYEVCGMEYIPMKVPYIVR